MNAHAPPKKAGGIGPAAQRKLTSAKKLRASPREINNRFGPPELCTWRYSPGICRIQTRSPEFARKLAQRSGARLVIWSVAGGYLRLIRIRERGKQRGVTVVPFDAVARFVRGQMEASTDEK